MNNNPCYEPGAMWKTRTSLKAFKDNKNLNRISIPRGEFILLMEYQLNLNYEEHIMFLWQENVCFAFNIDTGLTFDLNPDKINDV